MRVIKTHIIYFICNSLYSYILPYSYLLIILFSYSFELNCTEELPFYNKIYNYCEKYCSYNNLLNSICIPSSSINSSIDATIKIIEEILQNSTINVNQYEYIINGENVTFQITSSELLKKYHNMNNSYSNSYINLGECENNLKVKYLIPLNEPLIIILVNIINTSYITTYNKGFLIYDPINKSRLNIFNTCNSEEDIFYFNISVLPGNITNNINYTFFNKKGFNLANENDPFYDDVCQNYTFNFNSDLPLKYRKNEYKEYIFDTCGDNCTMVEYDFVNYKIFCKCYTSYSYKIKKEGKGNKNIFNHAKLNFNVLQCYKNILNLNYSKIYTVISFILLSFLLLLFIILMLIYFIRKKKSFKEIIENVMKHNKEIANFLNNSKGRGIYNKNNNIKKADGKNNSQEKQSSSFYLSRTDPSNLVTRMLKESANGYLIIQNESNTKEKIRKINFMNINENKKNLQFYKTVEKRDKLNVRVIYEKKIIFNEPSNNQNEEKILNFNENKNNNKTNDRFLIENINPLNFYSEYNAVKNINLIIKNERILYYSDTEMNLFEYNNALQIDTRSPLRYYWSIILDNDILFYSFGLWNNDYTFSTVKIAFFIFSFNLILFINICFMSESDIYHLFEVQGKYIFKYYILKSSLSMLICIVIILFMKYLIFGINNIFSIRNFEKEVFEENVKKEIKSIHTKNIIFFVIGLVFNLFIWYFVICFCLVYVNNEIVLITNGLVTFAEIVLYPFILAIFSVIFRYTAINNEKANKKKLYEFNKYFEFILL